MPFLLPIPLPLHIPLRAFFLLSIHIPILHTQVKQHIGDRTLLLVHLRSWFNDLHSVQRPYHFLPLVIHRQLILVSPIPLVVKESRPLNGYVFLDARFFFFSFHLMHCSVLDNGKSREPEPNGTTKSPRTIAAFQGSNLPAFLTNCRSVHTSANV